MSGAGLEPAAAMGSTPPQDTAAEAAWTAFHTRALKTRMAPGTFADFAPLLAARHHLAPFAVADLLLRPPPWSSYNLDPRVSEYLQILLDLKLVDVQAVLAAVYRWSSVQTLVSARRLKEEDEAAAAEAAMPGLKSEAGDGEDSKVEAKTAGLVRWENSYSNDEAIFCRLWKMVASGAGIKDGKDALEVGVLVARWMMLFATVLPHEHDPGIIMGHLNNGPSVPHGVRVEVENSRTAFTSLLISFCENSVVLQALGSSQAKGE